MKSNPIYYDEAFLRTVALPVRTDSYTPIPHLSVIDKIREELDKNNLMIDSFEYLTARDAKVLVGNYNISAGNPDYQMRIMFKNSYDKTVSFGMTSGISVFLCTNGALTGEDTLKRKHTGDADLDIDSYIGESVKSISDYYERLVKDLTNLKQYPMDNLFATSLAGRLFMIENVISSMQLNIVKEQLYESKHFKHMDDDEFSAFDFYQAITESLKKSHPTTYIADHANLHTFMMKIFNY
jgi:hypothetical protein